MSTASYRFPAAALLLRCEEILILSVEAIW